ncbi:MAG: hypothetical protein ACHREM_22655 [Polyangiales bacterium]
MTMPRRPDGATSVAVVIPLHALNEHGEPVVARRPGRPRRVEKAPTISEDLYNEALFTKVSEAINIDDIVLATMSDDPISVIDETMHAVACEAAALLWDRQRAQKEGKADAGRISSRRVAALVRVGELAVLRESLRRDGGEPKAEHVEAITRMISADVEAVVEDVAPTETAAAFVARLRERIAKAAIPNEPAPSPTPTAST